jgi:cation transporter-like permease
MTLQVLSKVISTRFITSFHISILLSTYAQEASGFFQFGVSHKILHVSLVSLAYVFIIHSFITQNIIFVTYKCKASRHAII